MSSHKENEAWKEASLDSARPGTKLATERLAQQRQRQLERKETKGDGVTKTESAAGAGRRLAPFYKVMQGMPITVDAFRYGKIPGVEAYLLRCESTLSSLPPFIRF